MNTYCQHCESAITDDMKEGTDWHLLNDRGDDFPVCKRCYEMYY